MILDRAGTLQKNTSNTGTFTGLCISGNVRNHHSDRGPEITIRSTAKIIGDNAPGIYAAGYGIWTIEEGAEITGTEALSIKSGKWTINGGTFIPNGVFYDPTISYRNG